MIKTVTIDIFLSACAYVCLAEVSFCDEEDENKWISFHKRIRKNCGNLLERPLNNKKHG